MDVDVAKNLRAVLANLPAGVRLVAISKFHPNEYIEAAYAAGQRIFGESHEQELAQKVKTLPKDIEWHFIGHLQTNKVKYIAPYISMIEAVDSMKPLREINKQALKNNRVIPVFARTAHCRGGNQVWLDAGCVPRAARSKRMARPEGRQHTRTDDDGL